MLAQGMKNLPSDELHRLFPSYSSEDISNLPYSFYQASLMALEAGKCDVIPQIRHIQVSNRRARRIQIPIAKQTSLLCVPFLFVSLTVVIYLSRWAHCSVALWLWVRG